MMGILGVPANNPPQIRIDRSLDDKRSAMLEERPQLRRQQADHLLGDELVRVETPGERRLGNDQRDEDCRNEAHWPIVAGLLDLSGNERPPEAPADTGRVAKVVEVYPHLVTVAVDDEEWEARPSQVGPK